VPQELRVQQLAVTAIGADRPGIVAAVSRVLHERGGNLQDSAMTILGGHFAIVLLVATDDDPAALREALAAATAELGLTISVSRAEGGRAQADPTHLLSVYGADHPGIVAGVTAVLAELGANVTDLETQVIGAEDEPVYAMVIEVVADDEAVLAARLAEVCRELGVDHNLRAIDVETY
jgi:glycine cleavage system transcriptional repressor